MDKNIIDQVRSAVLKKVSSSSSSSKKQHEYDERDMDSLIMQTDGFIRLSCNQYAESHDGRHDITAITGNIAETLRWRKAVSINDISGEDFPLEIFTRNPAFAHEDEEYVLVSYTMRDESRICQSWSDLTFKFMLRNYEISLKAAMSGKKNIFLCDTSNLSLSKIDVSMQSQLMKIMDKHYPDVFHSMYIYGLPRFMTSVANFFTKLVLPARMKKKFFVIDADSVSAHVPEKILPLEFGGTVKLRDALEFFQLKPKSIRDDPNKWPMDAASVAQVLKSCYGAKS